MRECQLCGAKSWGPFLRRRNDYPITTTPEDELVQCDVCDSVARRDIVEKPVPSPDMVIREGLSPGVGLETFFSTLRGPDPMTIAKEALESMQARMPQPETRLERIVRAIIAQGRFCSADGLPQNECIALVSYARAIEQEMDKTP